MRKDMWRKELVLVIIVLFIGASVIPSITGHDGDVEKIDYMLNENETLHMKNDDYNNMIKQVIENGVMSTDDWLEQDKLLASDGANNDWFGWSVSISGDYAIVGAHLDDDNGASSGSAYVFKKNNIPDLDCDGTLNWQEVEPGSTVTGSFAVENIGDPNTELDWEIVSYPDWGTWTFIPDSGEGLTPEDGVITVQVEVVVPDEADDELTGEVKIVNSEDTDDFCTIDATMTKPVSQISGLPNEAKVHLD